MCEYFESVLESEKDISAVVRNPPTSITDFEIYKEQKNLNYPIKSVTRLLNKNKLPLPVINKNML